jgi:hypothetical protein
LQPRDPRTRRRPDRRPPGEMMSASSPASPKVPKGCASSAHRNPTGQPVTGDDPDLLLRVDADGGGHGVNLSGR